jgi:hypothetical protein
MEEIEELERKGFEITYWNGDCLGGDWDLIRFESYRAAKKAGWVIREVINGNFMGHLPRKGPPEVIEDPDFPVPSAIEMARIFLLEKAKRLAAALYAFSQGVY